MQIGWSDVATATGAIEIRSVWSTTKKQAGRPSLSFSPLGMTTDHPLLPSYSWEKQHIEKAIRKSIKLNEVENSSAAKEGLPALLILNVSWHVIAGHVKLDFSTWNWPCSYILLLVIRKSYLSTRGQSQCNHVCIIYWFNFYLLLYKQNVLLTPNTIVMKQVNWMIEYGIAAHLAVLEVGCLKCSSLRKKVTRTIF